MKQRLKSLELHGYKTFASKTRFEFPDQITAIVGPNGSGKSNIADAVCWVLGEQAYSLLRGKKTIDMIFAGSELRPRASMASTTIIFDNEDNWLPIDYSEVSLTRRAYRNGENEYLLNNTRVRLKEINELLANSGLSERTYTIIGQGLVDIALSIKPEERRRFFEEAAGIELYRSRRNEALQKLDSSRRNIERVQDILSELIPRLKSLEKQAERAKEHDRIKADLLILLKDWYGFQWNRIQGELAFALDMQRKQEEHLNIAREAQYEFNKKIESVRTQISLTRTNLAQWHQESSALHHKDEQINREIAVLQERRKALEEKRQDLEREVAILEEEFQSRNKQLDELKLEKMRKSDDFQKAEAAFEATNRKIIERQEKRKKVEAEIKTARESIEKYETRKVQVNIHCNELDHRILFLEKNIEDLTSAYTKDVEESSTLEKEIDKQKQIIASSQIELDALLKQLTNQEVLVQDIEKRIKENHTKHAHLKADKLSQQAQLDVLEYAEQTLTGFTSGSKILYQAARNGKVSGKYDLLLSHIRVPAQYEVAIASVLGELLEALILDEKTDPEKTLRYLEENESGRTALLPKAWISTEKDSASKYSSDSIVSARQIIESTDDLKPVISAILRNVLIVKDRKIARELLAGTKDNLTIVTQKGEVFYSSGLVVAGKEVRVKAISQTREKELLVKTIQNINQEILVLESRLEKDVSEIEHKQKIKMEMEEKRNSLQSKTSRLNEVLNSQVIKTNQLTNKLNWQNQQIQSLKQQIENSEKGKADLSLEDEKLKEQSQEYRARNEELFNQLKALPLDELQDELFICSTNKAVEEQAVNNYNLRIEEIQQQLEAINLERDIKVRKTKDNENALNSLIDQNQTLLALEAEVEKGLNILEAKITPAEKELEDVETQYLKLQKDQEQARQQFAVTERHAIQAQMKLTRTREQQDNLRRRIEEDFGLVFYEYGQAVGGPTPLPIDGMVESLPKLNEVPQELEENIKQQKSILRRMGPINPEARKEYQEVQERYQFLTEQLKDLEKAISDLRQVVSELDDLMKTEFQETFHQVNDVFKKIFEKLFGGGSANLVITDEENITESGIDIEATLPGKRKQELASLSGGERSLTAVALIFALLKVSPPPFCILDEVDAMLDESNVMRFGDLLRELSQTTQFIVITHNRDTVQLANVLYGVTMGKDSTSQVISLKLDELTEELVQ